MQVKHVTKILYCNLGNSSLNLYKTGHMLLMHDVIDHLEVVSRTMFDVYKVYFSFLFFCMFTNTRVHLIYTGDKHENSGNKVTD
jgi:hypothetical protein